MLLTADNLGAKLAAAGVEAPKPTAGHTVPRPASAGSNRPYVDKAVSDELEILRTTPEHGVSPLLPANRQHRLGRANTAFDVACNLFEFVKAGHLDGAAAEDLVRGAARQTGLPDTEIDNAIKSAWNRVGPRDVPEPGGHYDVGDTTFEPKTREPDPPVGLDDAPATAGLMIDGPGATSEAAELPRLATLLLTRDALKELPDPEPLIDDTLDRGTTALLYGRWGSLKSFIAYDWAASLATGRAWQGRPTKKTKALYIAAEGAFGFKGRTDAWERGWHTTIADDDLHILPHPVNLTRPVEVDELRALIQWNGYGFVVIDTLARCMVGGDENSAKDCGLVVDALIKLRHATPDGRGVVLGVHHTGKDAKTFRGSSVFEAGADTVYSTTHEGAMVVLKREKRKDGQPLDRHQLRFDPIDGTGSGVVGVVYTGDTKGVSGPKLADIVHDVIAAMPGRTIESTRMLYAGMRRVGHQFDEKKIRDAVDDLVVAGRLVELPGKNNARGYRATANVPSAVEEAPE
jgi:hypothetical protein